MADPKSLKHYENAHRVVTSAEDGFQYVFLSFARIISYQMHTLQGEPVICERDMPHIIHDIERVVDILRAK